MARFEYLETLADSMRASTYGLNSSPPLMAIANLANSLSVLYRCRNSCQGVLPQVAVSAALIAESCWHLFSSRSASVDKIRDLCVGCAQLYERCEQLTRTCATPGTNPLAQVSSQLEALETLLLAAPACYEHMQRLASPGPKILELLAFRKAVAG